MTAVSNGSEFMFIVSHRWFRFDFESIGWQNITSNDYHPETSTSSTCRHASLSAAVYILADPETRMRFIAMCKLFAIKLCPQTSDD